MLLNGIFELASNDMIVANKDSGINNYDMQYKFADKLEEVRKYFAKLNKDCADEAVKVRERIQVFQDNKNVLQESYFVQEIVKESQKVKEARDPNPTPYIRDETVLLKREHYAPYLSDSDEEQTLAAGDIDTKFKYRKTNSNDENLHTYPCEDCDQVFRDSQELRNHQSTHHKELYKCMSCNNVSRSVRSFFNHTQAEHSIVYTCSFPDCDDKFKLKSSLRNHIEKHSEFWYTCQLTSCGKKFKFRGSYLEHVNYRHRDSKSVPCPVCKKMYWTPTSMRSHCAKIHGLVTEMFREG